MIPIAMGSCYLDKGEGLDYVQAQIVRMGEMKPTAYYFDIICRSDQIPEAVRLLGQFYDIVGEVIPHLPTDKIFTAITCDDMIRPAAMALAVTTRDGDIDMLDLNLDRKAR